MMTADKIVALVFGILGVLAGAALIAGATVILTEDRDDDGFFTSDQYAFAQPSRAIVSEDIELLTGAPSWLIDRITDPVDLRIQGTSASDEGLFVGVAPTADVEIYLSGVAHHEVTSLDFDGSSITSVDYQSIEGTAVPALPGSQGFWQASTEGATVQTLDWPLESGSWTFVLMNADASAGVDADLTLGAKISNNVTISWIAMAIGIVSVLGGAYLVYRGIRRPGVLDGGEQALDLREEGPPIETPLVEKQIAGKSQRRPDG